MARRALILMALLIAIGTSAYGARQIISDGAPNPAIVRQGGLVTVGSGRAETDQWTLQLYRRGADLCRVLVAGEAETSRCAPAPAGNALAVTSLTSPTRRYVFGVSGMDVAHVAIAVDGARLTVATHTLSPGLIHAGDLPSTTRWFLATTPRTGGPFDPPAHVHGLDIGGRRLGPEHLSCVESSESQPSCH